MEISSWIIEPKPERSAVERLMQDAGLTELVASLLIQRGMSDPQEVIAFLNPGFTNMHHPMLMKDMRKAVERLNEAIEDDERILIYGDYDVDGTTAVAMTASYLQGVGVAAVNVDHHPRDIAERVGVRRPSPKADSPSDDIVPWPKVGHRRRCLGRRARGDQLIGRNLPAPAGLCPVTTEIS